MRCWPIDRRTFVGAGGAAFLAGLLPRAADALQQSEVLLATAYLTDDGTFGAAILSEDGTIIARVALPDRGHDVVFQPGPAAGAVVFARRPGKFACAFTTDRSSEPLFFQAPHNRHFYGHGTFSADGRLLYATENDFQNARGLIGIYDATANFRRIGEFPTDGIGPHDIRLMPDGRTLAIANGGIETHPDYGRSKLNIPTMEPSLVLLDATDGAIIGKAALAPALSKLSLRHVDGDDKGRLWIAGQYEGDPAHIVPLVHVWSDEAGLHALPLPDNATARLKGYVGSVAYNGKAGRIAISSPRGGVVVHCPIANPADVTIVEQHKVCGLASFGQRFASTSIDGSMRIESGQFSSADYLWDNHLSAVAARSG